MSALLIIDVQYDFMEGGSLEVNDASAILDPINELRKKMKFDLVVLSQDWHPQDHVSFASNNPGKKPFDTMPYHGGVQVLWPNHCVQGSHGSDFHSGLYREPEDVVVRKGMDRLVDSYSAFMDNDHKRKTEMDQVLKAANIHTVYVCGIASDYCVAFTCLDAVAAGYKTYLLEDACRGVAPDTTASQFNKLKENNVTFIRCSDLCKQ
ncbi:hypothetical protein SAMD00019534_051580 [Acytostelium subglobosum LB1]|uniref:hypothetical protein n=1 Tax=Acytostelium subglobosum LB1 TaxID=1410327 RepID=UPI000644A47B|nr:hypothetical protein SAMD00019534_051580 [Acytostelium subglobosum LB1]GAM21983.1 hypothetical protein SAMD00019534_051580 [Acytostelium subglobosum LB1]|eukprot:XP_012755083.1 hypothetical protein SAMD00019534_051580 [Acytostelium subglobosum LB1]